MLGAESVDMHRIAIHSLRVVSCCNEDVRTHTDWVCEGCIEEIGRIKISIGAENCVLGRFLDDILTFGHLDPHFTRSMCQYVARLVEKRVAKFELYLGELSSKLDKSSIEYWKRYGSLTPTDLEAIPEAMRSSRLDNNYQHLYTYFLDGKGAGIVFRATKWTGRIARRYKCIVFNSLNVPPSVCKHIIAICLVMVAA